VNLTRSSTQGRLLFSLCLDWDNSEAIDMDNVQ